MADDIVLNAGTGGDTLAADDIAGKKYPRSKLVHGADGVNAGDVSTANPFPTSPRTPNGDSVCDDTNDAVKVVSATAANFNVTEASAAAIAASASVLDDWDESDRAKVNPIVGVAGVAAGAGAISSSTQRVCVASDNSVTVAQSDPTLLNALISGRWVHDNSVASDGGLSPVLAGAKASAAAPTSVSADSDATFLWALRNGALCTQVTAAGALIGGDATNGLDVDVTRVSGTVTISGAVTNAGTFAVQVDGTALTKLTDIETNTDSGAVVGNGAAATAQRVTIANDSTGILAGVTTVTTVTTVSTVTTCSTVTTLTGSAVAHDAADSGNPHKIGAKATGAMTGRTLVAADDRSDLFSGLDGVLINRPHAPLEDQLQETKSNTDGASTAMTSGFAAPGANIRLYLTTLIIANSSASNITVDIRDGSAGSVLATVPVPANGGVVINLPVPLKFTANTAAAFDGSAAASTLYVTMIGFKSKVG